MTYCRFGLYPTVMKRTVYIPDALWEQLETYLQERPEQNASSVVQAALADKLRPRNGAGLLELAGLVKHAPEDASTNEDALM